MRHIPYEEIKGGKPYFLEQRYTGSIYLIAWILSGDRVDGKAPIVFLMKIIILQQDLQWGNDR